MNYKIYKKVEEIPTEWDDLNNNTFLNLPFLQAQEVAASANMHFFYLAFFEDENLVAKVVCQKIKLKGKNTFRKSKNALQNFAQNRLNLTLLSVGNIILTGENVADKKESLSWEKLIPQIEKAVEEINKREKISLILYKDFTQKQLPFFEKFLSKNYQKVEVQPNMVMEIPVNWTCFDDYLAEFKSKYRIRVKRALKKLDDVDFRELDLNFLIENEKIVHQLYKNISDEVAFNTYEMPQNYFTEMERFLEENFTAFGGFLNGELICFYTLIDNGNTLETGFLGYDKNLQQERQLYLNMLYEMIKFGIEKNYQKIIFSRSALEIKSSVGAQPVETFAFLKHRHSIKNFFLEQIFNYFNPKESWTPRNPFRD